MPARKDGGKTPVKVKAKRKPSVGSAITQAAKGKDVSFAPKAKPAPKPRSAAPLMTGKSRSTNAGVGAKSKGTVKVKKKGVLADVERNLRAATHLLYPKGSKETPKGTGRLGAVGGNQLDLKNSAAGIVLRSTTAEAIRDPQRAAKDVGKATVGIPAGLIRAAANPKESAKAIPKDYAHRYGAAFEGDYKKFNERQDKEGITGELFDLAGVASAGGATTGRVLQKAAQAGSLGSKAKTVATRETRLRVSGGAEGVKVRKPSKNYWKNSAQNRLDNSRAKKQAKRAAKPEAPGIVREAEAANKAAGRIVEVTPKTKRAVKRAQKRDVAGQGGITLQTMKAHQSREVHSGKTGVAATRKGLTKDEQAAYKYQAQYGPKTPAAARAILEKHRERVIAERAANPDVKPIVDELPVIEKLIEKADQAFTPRLRQRVQVEGNRSRRIARIDPDIDEGQALRRTYMPAAELLGVKALRSETAKEFAKRKRKLAIERQRAEKAMLRAKAVADKRTAVAGVRISSRDRAILRTDEGYVAAARAYNAAARNLRDTQKKYGNAARYPNQKLYGDKAPLETVRAVNAARAKADAAKKALDTELARVEARARAEFGKKQRGEKHDAKLASLYQIGSSATSVERAQGRLAATELRLAKLKDAHKSAERRIEGETAVQFARRVREAGRERGLGSAAYFKSEEIPKGVNAVFAKGGARAVAGDRQYTGALTRTGRESGDLDIVSRSAAGGIKRFYNWNHVAKTVDRHVFSWSRNTKHTAYDLERQIRLRGIDPDTVALWNPRLYREAQKGVAAAEQLPDADPSLVSTRVHDATRNATATLDDLATNREQFSQAGWQLAPKDAIDEVMSTSGGHGEGAVGRGYDITKGQISRVLLANPAWLGFQVASNGLMSGLAGVTPADMLRAPAFWKKLSPEDRAAAQAIYGTHGWFKEQRRMGAAGGQWTAGWNALKDTPFYRRALDGKSPLDALFFRPDNAQNNFFRNALMYNRIKRQAYREMGANATVIARSQQRLTGILKGNPEDQMLALAKNKKVVEAHAQAVDDFLGNWTRYTAAERRGWSRFVMFYGFLRFATRLAFYTMPVKHPIMSSILLQVGRLEKDELERIFGTEPPPWEYGNLYAPTAAWGENPSREETNFRVPTTRLVPFFNALQYGNPGAPIGMLNPGVGLGLNQLTGKNTTMDQPYTVDGSTAYVQKSADLGSLFPPSANRLQIMLGEGLRLSPYYRAAEAAILRGNQSDDSSLLFPQAIKYPGTTAKSKAAIVRNQTKIAEQERRAALGALQETLAPQIGTGGNSRIDSARSFAKSKGKGKKPKVRATDPWGGGTSSSSTKSSDPWGG